MKIEEWIQPEILETTCDDVIQMSITRSYTQEELNSFKFALSAATIESKARTKALAKIKKEFEITQHPELLMASVQAILEETEELTESGTKALNSEIAMYIEKLKTKKYTSDEEVYVIKQYDISKVSFYDKEGNLVSSRPMRPDERQTNIKSLNFN